MKPLTLILFALSAHAQLTTVSQYVANGDGSPFMGEVTIQVPPFASRSFAVRSRDIWLCSSANVITGCAQQIVNGVLTVQLLPNGGGSPSGTSYFVSYYPDVPPGRRPSVKTEYWVVPTGGPYTIDQVKTSTPPVPSVQVSPTQLNPTGYTTGQFPCIVGGTFLPCSPTAGATWGSITGTLSNQTDLQTSLNAKASLSAGNSFVTVDPNGLCAVGSANRLNTVNGRYWGCNGIWRRLSTDYPNLVPSSLALANIGSGPYEATADAVTVLGGVDGWCVYTTSGGYFTSGTCQVFWGQIIGNLSSQTDLQAALNAKAATTAGTQSGARPACASGTRSQTWFVAGGAGVQDSFSICAKDAGDVYAWRAIY